MRALMRTLLFSSRSSQANWSSANLSAVGWSGPWEGKQPLKRRTDSASRPTEADTALGKIPGMRKPPESTNPRAAAYEYFGPGVGRFRAGRKKVSSPLPVPARTLGFDAGRIALEVPGEEMRTLPVGGRGL